MDTTLHLFTGPPRRNICTKLCPPLKAFGIGASLPEAVDGTYICISTRQPSSWHVAHSTNAYIPSCPNRLSQSALMFDINPARERARGVLVSRLIKVLYASEESGCRTDVG